jgi:hypothetical protein
MALVTSMTSTDPLVTVEKDATVVRKSTGRKASVFAGTQVTRQEAEDFGLLGDPQEADGPADDEVTVTPEPEAEAKTAPIKRKSVAKKAAAPSKG